MGLGLAKGRTNAFNGFTFTNNNTVNPESTSTPPTTLPRMIHFVFALFPHDATGTTVNTTVNVEGFPSDEDDAVTL